MTIAYTPEMRELSDKIRPWLVTNDKKHPRPYFKEGTPQEIIELDKRFTELWKEEERKTIELDEFGWG